MDDGAGCIACDLTIGRVELPGGLIHRTIHWRVEHCVGPLGVGTLIVKPSRHVLHVADLTESEAGEFMPAPEIRATRYTATEFEQACSNASLTVEAVHHRPPLPHEHQGDRVYLLARAL